MTYNAIQLIAIVSILSSFLKETGNVDELKNVIITNEPNNIITNRNGIIINILIIIILEI